VLPTEKTYLRKRSLPYDRKGPLPSYKRSERVPPVIHVRPEVSCSNRRIAVIRKDVQKLRCAMAHHDLFRPAE
jgi:hypothetical protein